MFFILLIIMMICPHFVRSFSSSTGSGQASCMYITDHHLLHVGLSFHSSPPPAPHQCDPYPNNSTDPLRSHICHGGFAIMPNHQLYLWYAHTHIPPSALLLSSHHSLARWRNQTVTWTHAMDRCLFATASGKSFCDLAVSSIASDSAMMSSSSTFHHHHQPCWMHEYVEELGIFSTFALGLLSPGQCATLRIRFSDAVRICTQSIMPPPLPASSPPHNYPTASLIISPNPTTTTTTNDDSPPLVSSFYIISQDVMNIPRFYSISVIICWTYISLIISDCIVNGWRRPRWKTSVRIEERQKRQISSPRRHAYSAMEKRKRTPT